MVVRHYGVVVPREPAVSQRQLSCDVKLSTHLLRSSRTQHILHLITPLNRTCIHNGGCVRFLNAILDERERGHLVVVVVVVVVG